MAPRMTKTAAVTVLGCSCACLLSSRSAFVAVGSSAGEVAAGHGSLPGEVPLALQGSQRLRRSAGTASQGRPSGAAASTGIAAALGVAAALAVRFAGARRVARTAGVQRRALPQFNMTEILPSGNWTDMTDQEAETWLEERCAGLRKIMPMTETELDDKIADLHWQWGRHTLPFLDKRRDEIAGNKRKHLLLQKGLWEKMRLFKPLAIKYPTLMKRFIKVGKPNIENNEFELNARWFENTERIAGFTYEDLANETTAGTFEKWDSFSVGDLVSGVVVSMNTSGAFVEIGAKGWAFMPTKNCSLAAVKGPSDVMTVGQEIEAKIINMGVESQARGDRSGRSIILSVTEMQRESAWDEVAAVWRGEGEQIQEVYVKSMTPLGAVVQTVSGLMGLIPTLELDDRAGDFSLVGQKLSVTYKSVDRSKSEIVNPERPSEFGLTFSYRDVIAQQLAETLTEGMIITGKVKAVQPMEISIAVEVSGVTSTLQLKKVDVSSDMNFEMDDMFTVGEEIKAYVFSLLAGTGVRLSTRALEPKRGMMVKDKAKCFEQAEQTAQKYFTVAQGEYQKVEAALVGALSDDIFGDGDDAAQVKKKPGSVDIEDGLSDDETF